MFGLKITSGKESNKILWKLRSLRKRLESNLIHQLVANVSRSINKIHYDYHEQNVRHFIPGREHSGATNAEALLCEIAIKFYRRHFLLLADQIFLMVYSQFRSSQQRCNSKYTLWRTLTINYFAITKSRGMGENRKDSKSSLRAFRFPSRYWLRAAEELASRKPLESRLHLSPRHLIITLSTSVSTVSSSVPPAVHT